MVGGALVLLANQTTKDNLLPLLAEGKVSFVWSTYDKYVRVPGSAASYFQAQSGGGDTMAKAAIAAADPYVYFTGGRAVYFLAPKGQKVFM